MGPITSAECGDLVAFIRDINTMGNSIPPMFVFSRINYKQHFVRHRPTGSVGAGNKPAWTTEEVFCKLYPNFVEKTLLDKENQFSF